MGLMLQEGGVYPMARPHEVLRLFSRFHADPLDPDALLERVGLATRDGPASATSPAARSSGCRWRSRWSGGPRWCSSTSRPPGSTRRRAGVTWEHVRELQADRVTVVLTTHLLDEAEELADRVAIIDQGRLIALGTPDELTHGDRGELEFSARPGLDVAGLGAAVGAAVDEPARAATSSTPRTIRSWSPGWPAGWPTTTSCSASSRPASAASRTSSSGSRPRRAGDRGDAGRGSPATGAGRRVR
jgi:hypothetical protein